MGRIVELELRPASSSEARQTHLLDALVGQTNSRALKMTVLTLSRGNLGGQYVLGRMAGLHFVDVWII